MSNLDESGSIADSLSYQSQKSLLRAFQIYCIKNVYNYYIVLNINHILNVYHSLIVMVDKFIARAMNPYRP